MSYWLKCKLRPLLLVLAVVLGSTAVVKVADARCQVTNTALESMGAAQVEFTYADGNTFLIDARLADDNQTRAAGFQRVCASSIAEKPILFVFARAVRPQFHMNNVVADIDIAFVGRNGQIDSIQAMQPYILGSKNRPKYGPERAVVFALETAPGFFEEHEINKTVTVSWKQLKP